MASPGGDKPMHDSLGYTHITLSCSLNYFQCLVDGQKRVALRHGLSWMESQRMKKLCSCSKYSEGRDLVMSSLDTWDSRVSFFQLPLASGRKMAE